MHDSLVCFGISRDIGSAMASLPPLPKAVIEITYMSPSDWGRPLTGYGTGAPELDLPICCLLTTGYGPELLTRQASSRKLSDKHRKSYSRLEHFNRWHRPAGGPP